MFSLMIEEAGTVMLFFLYYCVARISMVQGYVHGVRFPAVQT
jgi:hypothetical protein